MPKATIRLHVDERPDVQPYGLEAESLLDLQRWLDEACARWASICRITLTADALVALRRFDGIINGGALRKPRVAFVIGLAAFGAMLRRGVPAIELSDIGPAIKTVESWPEIPEFRVPEGPRPATARVIARAEKVAREALARGEIVTRRAIRSAGVAATREALDALRDKLLAEGLIRVEFRRSVGHRTPPFEHWIGTAPQPVGVSDSAPQGEAAAGG